MTSLTKFLIFLFLILGLPAVYCARKIESGLRKRNLGRVMAIGIGGITAAAVAFLLGLGLILLFWAYNVFTGQARPGEHGTVVIVLIPLALAFAPITWVIMTLEEALKTLKSR